MNERDDEIAKLIYGTQATYQEMQFAALIRADEREACAKACDALAIKTTLSSGLTVFDASDCAAGIRARENK